ncbi:cytoskeleton protein RodZ [Celerinatantimonas yamalensis]|uniref:Cytoskeleton protein RodZ n=1 Tax=Celerinatantimonas yamalensis TaxID=559956 RepID=A0ABW9G9V1_9GAMM
MTTESKHIPDSDERAHIETSQPSAGQRLKEAREAAGLSAQDVATRLNLRCQVIVDIEDDNAQQTLSTTFFKGYIRSYAKLLNIPESSVLDTTYHHQDAVKPVKMDKFSKPVLEERRRDGKLKWLTLLIIVIVLASLGGWWWQNHSLKDFLPSSFSQSGELNISHLLPTGDSSKVEAPVAQSAAQIAKSKQDALPTAAMPSPPADAATEAAKVATQLDTPQASDTSQGANKVSSAPVAQTAAVDSTQVAQPAPLSHTITQPTTSPVSVPSGQLQLSFSKACWIEVSDAAGNRLAVGVKQPGQVLELNGQAPYSVVLGVPDGVSIKYGGKPVLFNSSNVNGKTAHITVPN